MLQPKSIQFSFGDKKITHLEQFLQNNILITSNQNTWKLKILKYFILGKTSYRELT